MPTKIASAATGKARKDGFTVKALGSIPDGLTIDLLEELIVLVPHLGGAGSSPLLAGVADRVRRDTVSCTTSASISTGTNTGTYTNISTHTGTTNTNGRGRGHDYFHITTPTKKLLPFLLHTVLVVALQAHHPQLIVDGVALVVVHGLEGKPQARPSARHGFASPAKPREPSCRLGSKDPRSSPLRYPNGFASAEQLCREVKKIRTGERNQKN